MFFISFYISRYDFSQIFRPSFNITWKKKFVTNFTFLTDSLTPIPPPLTVKIHKSATRDKFFIDAP